MHQQPKIETAYMYGGPLRRCFGLVNITNHRREDNLKCIKFRECASAINKLINMLGYKHVKDTGKINNDEFRNNWKRSVNDGTYTTTSMHELFDMTKSRRISDDRPQQVLVYVNKILKPYDIGIR